MAETVASLRAMMPGTVPLQGEPPALHGVADLQLEGPGGPLALRCTAPRADCR